jgi:DNA methylase
VTALYVVGDVFDRVAELRRRRVRVALVLCSPPFLALRSYLPDGHPLKSSEIGSEATPAAFVDVMLALVAELAHVLEPWGSIAFELGDTYSGSGGAGGDYDPEGLRAGQNAFAGSAKARRSVGDYPVRDDTPRPDRSGRGAGWPLEKSLAGIPQAFMLSLAYGYNVLDRRGPDSPAGRWRVRNLKPWIRSNPPVGALGDKERPATSYVTVATRDAARYFDLDAVRTTPAPHTLRYPRDAEHYSNEGYDVAGRGDGGRIGSNGGNAAGAPPRDWWHHVDAVLDACLDDNPTKTVTHVETNSKDRRGLRGGNWSDGADSWSNTHSVRGVHLRRALERAGILATVDAIDCSPKGYRGAHYAVWPPELVKQLVLEMCPRRVCTTCGQPSRRIVGEAEYHRTDTDRVPARLAKTDGARVAAGVNQHHTAAGANTSVTRSAPTLGWSDCGHGTWTPGRVLDPFVGSGTTLQVCSGLGRDSIGIDLDYTNVGLAMARVGMWLAVEWPPPDLDALEHRALGAGSPHPASYDRWSPLLEGGRRRGVLDTRDEPGLERTEHAPISATYKRPPVRALPSVAGQLDLLGTT